MRIALPVLVVTALSLFGEPTRHEFLPTQGARLTVTVEKTGLWSGRKHVFEFARYRAEVFFDRDAPERSRVQLTIDAASATCGDTWVSEKDRRQIVTFMLHQMLDVERHPQLQFRSTGIAVTGVKTFEVSGMLAVRGMEKPATVSVALEGSTGTLATVTGRAIVRLTDYGLKPPKAALGTIGTRNEMTVEFRLIAAGGR